VAVHARLHFHLQNRLDQVLRPDVSMTRGAPDIPSRVLPVTEEDEIGKAINRRVRLDPLGGGKRG